MEYLSQAEMNERIKSDPKSYPLSIFNRAFSEDKKRIQFLYSLFHLYQVKYKDEYYWGIVNDYKKKDNSPITDEFKDTNAPNLDHIYEEQMIEHEDGSMLALFHPKITRKFKNRLRGLYLTETVRNRGKIRSGVVNIYLEDVDQSTLPQVLGIVSVEKL